MLLFVKLSHISKRASPLCSTLRVFVCSAVVIWRICRDLSRNIRGKTVWLRIQTELYGAFLFFGFFLGFDLIQGFTKCSERDLRNTPGTLMVLPNDREMQF